MRRESKEISSRAHLHAGADNYPCPLEEGRHAYSKSQNILIAVKLVFKHIGRACCSDHEVSEIFCIPTHDFVENRASTA
jgi:hypothetical protein